MEDPSDHSRLQAEVSRRDFTLLGVSAVASMSGSPLNVQSNVEVNDSDGVRAVAHLRGTEDQLPSKDFFENQNIGDIYVYEYYATDTGARYMRDNTMTNWKQQKPCIVQKQGKLYYRVEA